MTLYELASDLFIRLVVFRKKVAHKVPISAEGVAQEFGLVFARMDKKAAEIPTLTQRYQEIRKILAIVADGIITSSGWDKALDYRDQHLLEDKFYKSREGGATFFEELDELRPEDVEGREIFFLALSLGFKGKHARDPNVLVDLRNRLYHSLPRRVLDMGDKLTPQAYKPTDERDLTLAPVVRFGRYAITLVGILLFLLFVGRVVYDNQKSDIERIVSSPVIPKSNQ